MSESPLLSPMPRNEMLTPLSPRELTKRSEVTSTLENSQFLTTLPTPTRSLPRCPLPSRPLPPPRRSPSSRLQLLLKSPKLRPLVLRRKLTPRLRWRLTLPLLPRPPKLLPPPPLKPLLNTILLPPNLLQARLPLMLPGLVSLQHPPLESYRSFTDRFSSFSSILLG